MAADNDKGLSIAARLRHLAEEQLKGKTTAAGVSMPDDETLRLLHELDVYRIELEMQNAELLQARDDVEAVLGKYTDLYDFAPVGYFTLSPDGTILAVNLAGAGLLGVERSRLVGRRLGAFVPLKVRPSFSELLGKVFARQGKESCEVAFTREGNQPLFAQIEAVADASRQECRIAVIDITARRRTEDALAEKRLELEELNRSQAVHIATALDELRRKDELLILQERFAVMGEMINNIAHQWRQPLNALGLAIQQLPLFYGSAAFNSEFLQKNVDQSMELIRHMSRTIDDFRHFFRSDKEKVAFGVNRVIAQTLTLVEDNFREQKIGIVLHVEGEPVLTGYPNEYAQVLLNILMNARDVLVGRTVDAALISIRAFAEGGKTVVTITDNAGGVADEILGKLFDPYFTTKGPDKGTGIGLFMSKTIIEKNMGGRLTVRNAGSGAEFRIEV